MNLRPLVAFALLLGACGAEPAGPPTKLSAAEGEAMVDARLGPRGDASAPTAEPAPAVERFTLGARILDERSGEMLEMKHPCIVLEGVQCEARYSVHRLFCPRAITAYWREAWLERPGKP